MKTFARLAVTVALLTLLVGCARIRSYELPAGVPAVRVMFRNLAHKGTYRTSHMYLGLFSDDVNCYDFQEVSRTTREIVIDGESRGFYTVWYKVGSWLPNEPATFSDRCAGCYTFPTEPGREYLVEFNEVDKVCSFRVMSRAEETKNDWQTVSPLYRREVTVPGTTPGAWCLEDRRFLPH